MTDEAIIRKKAAELVDLLRKDINLNSKTLKTQAFLFAQQAYQTIKTYQEPDRNARSMPIDWENARRDWDSER